MSKRHGNKEVKKPKKKALSGAADSAVRLAVPGAGAPALTPPVAPRSKR